MSHPDCPAPDDPAARVVPFPPGRVVAAHPGEGRIVLTRDGRARVFADLGCLHAAMRAEDPLAVALKDDVARHRAALAAASAEAAAVAMRARDLIARAVAREAATDRRVEAAEARARRAEARNRQLWTGVVAGALLAFLAYGVGL